MAAQKPRKTKEKIKSQGSRVGNSIPHGYQSNPSRSIRNANQRPIGQSAVSIDSGLSSRLDAESVENHSELELKGLKGRLIQEIDGPITTTLVYQYNDERYKIK